MKKKFSKSELYLIETMSGATEGNLSKKLNIKVRKILGMSIPLSEDCSYRNIALLIMKEVAKTKGKEEGVPHKEWLNFIARSVKKFFRGNGYTATGELVKLLGSGNAKEFYSKYPTAKYYEELYAALQTWLTTPTPPSRIKISDYLLAVIIVVLNLIDGKIGKRVLKPRLRFIWRTITYGMIIWAFVKFILFPFFDLWDNVVVTLNALAWG